MELTTRVDAESLAALLGVREIDDDIRGTLAAAIDILAPIIGQAHRPIPETTMDDLVRRVARSLWDARRQPNAAKQLTGVQGRQGPAAPADPLASSWPIIGRYVVLGL